MSSFRMRVINKGQQLPELKNIKIPVNNNLKRDLISQARDFLKMGWVPIPLTGKIPVNKRWQLTTQENAIAILKKTIICSQNSSTLCSVAFCRIS